MDDLRQSYLKALPRVDEVLALLEKSGGSEGLSRFAMVEACRYAVDLQRKRILGAGNSSLERPTAEEAKGIAEERLWELRAPRLRRVINATGIIIHTNLGRAPLCDEALQALLSVGRGYSNLEFNLAEGKRGLRYDHVNELLVMLTGAEDAVVVNNNAAAVLLVLNTLAQGKEAVVSRGELVEIGGEFRIPEVMEKSGALLREVGTTNRTRLSDYEGALDEKTGLIMKVHTSNFTTIGFTEEVEARDLAELGRRTNIPVMHDLGSGCLLDLGKWKIGGEPTVQEAVRSGSDVVTFSGDKLLGGPQAGIILGRRSVIEAIKKNPLNRALRIDKLTLAALEATLRQYLLFNDPERRIPVLRAMTESLHSVRKRAADLMGRLEGIGDDRFSFQLKEETSLSGGGSLPGRDISTVAIAAGASHLSARELERMLRENDPPVIARINEEQILIDPRTLVDDEAGYVEEAFRRISEGE